MLKKKIIEPGGTVVEGTFGNTGIALTMINNARGYKTIIVMPEAASLEKRDILKNFRRRTQNCGSKAI